MVERQSSSQELALLLNACGQNPDDFGRLYWMLGVLYDRAGIRSSAIADGLLEQFAGTHVAAWRGEFLQSRAHGGVRASRKTDSVRRVGIVVPALFDGGGHTSTVLGLCRFLARDEFVVTVLSTEEFNDSSAAMGSKALRRLEDWGISYNPVPKHVSLKEKLWCLWDQVERHALDVAVFIPAPWACAQPLLELSISALRVMIDTHNLGFTPIHFAPDVHVNFFERDRQELLRLTPPQQEHKLKTATVIDYYTTEIESATAYSREELNLPHDVLLSGTFGAAYKLLGAESAYFRCLEEVLRAHPNLVHLLAGADDNRLHHELERLPEDVRGRVRYLGLRDDIPRLLKSLDLYVNSLPTSGGCIVLEAMAAGKPVVTLAQQEDWTTYRALNCAEVQIGAPSLIAPNVPELMQRISQLVQDAALRERLGSAMRRRWEQVFHPERTVREFAALIDHTHLPSYDVSIVIPVYNMAHLTTQCLTALASSTHGVKYEVIVVDNGSTDQTAALLATVRGNVQSIRNQHNLGFGKACNQGARAAKGRYILFLNNDTVPLAGWLTSLVEELDSDPQVAVVGSKLLYEDLTVQHAGVVFDRLRRPYHVYQRTNGQHPAVNVRREMNAVTAACMLIRREVFEAVGGFDEGFFNGFEDVDLCLKVREAHHRIVYQPRSVVLHLESQTPGRKQHDAENAKRLADRWKHCWWLTDEDSIFVPDGYKSVLANTEDGAGHCLALLDGEADARSWGLVAATQAAAQHRDVGAVEMLLRRYREWPADVSVLVWAGNVALAIQLPELTRDLVQYVKAGDRSKPDDLSEVREALNRGDLQKAERRLSMTLASHPHLGEAWRLTGVLHMQRNEYGEAQSAFATAMRHGAKRRNCLMGIGMALLGAVQPDRAWDEFLRMLEDNPDDAEAIHWLLRAGTAQNRWQKLSDHLRKYLSRNPADLSVRFALAGVLVRGEQIEAARREYETLRAISPAYDGLIELGQAISRNEAALATGVVHS